LLALAESANEFEADLALSKAQALATEYGIDLALAKMSGVESEKESFEKGTVETGQRMPITQLEVSIIIVNYFNCELVYAGNRAYGRRIYFVGRTSDVSLGIYVNSFLNNEFMKRWKRYKQNRDCSTFERASFLRGMRIGLADKLQKAKDEAEKNKFNSMANALAVKNQYALMIVNEKDALRKFKASLFSALKPVMSKKVAGTSHDEGYKAGQDINISLGLGSGSNGAIGAAKLALMG